MAVIGVGKAFRDQSRAAAERRSQRTPREDRRRSSVDSPVAPERCGVCGGSDFVLATEAGPLCMACEPDPEPSANRWLWIEGMLPLPGLLLTLMVYGILPIPAGPKRMGVWAIALGVGLVASMVSLLWGARMVRSPHDAVRRVGGMVAGVSGMELVSQLGVVVWIVASGLLAA